MPGVNMHKMDNIQKIKKDKKKSEVDILFFPKLVMELTGIACVIAIFLPWIANESLIQAWPFSAHWIVPLVSIGVIAFILNATALSRETKRANRVSNILSMLGGIVLAGEVMIQLYFTDSLAEYYQIALWMQLGAGITLFVFSIISMITTRRIIDSDDEEDE